MATLEWSQCPAVESIPGKVSGAWVFKDTRMPVSIVFENLEAGATIEEIMEWVPVFFIAFKLLVLGTAMFFAIKSHHDGEKQEQEEERERQNRINGS